MGDFEDRVNSILSDPSQMDKIANLAKSFMGGDGIPSDKGGTAAGEKNDSAGDIADLARSFMGGESGIDPAALGRISRLLSAGSARSDEKRALLEAMKPYLSEKRRGKMDKAMKIAQLARIAKLAMGEMGDDGDI